MFSGSANMFFMLVIGLSPVLDYIGEENALIICILPRELRKYQKATDDRGNNVCNLHGALSTHLMYGIWMTR